MDFRYGSQVKDFHYSSLSTPSTDTSQTEQELKFFQTLGTKV